MLVLVVTIDLDGGFFPKDEVRGGVLGVVAVGLTFLWTVDPVEPDAFGALVVQNLRVSPSRTETTGPVKSDASTTEKEEMKKPKVDAERISSLRLKWRASIIQLTPTA